MLSAEELRIYTDLVLAEDRRDYLASRSLLRVTLSLYGQRYPEAWTFERQESRTILRTESGQMTCSLSHTLGLVACAVTADQRFDIALGSASPDDVGVRVMEPGTAALSAVELTAISRALTDVLGAAASMTLTSPHAVALTGDRQIVFTPPPSAQVRRSIFELGLFAPAPRHRLGVAIFGPPAAHVTIVARAADDWRPLTVVGTTANAVVTS